MEQKNQNHNGGPGQGFILGVLVGVVITLLFTTKKGREVFKTLTEKGLDKFSDLEKRLQETTSNVKDEFEDIDEENDYVEPEKEVRHLAEGKPETHAAPKVEQKQEAPKKNSPVRKFFRIKKS